ncbi:Vms1/Ankzf1 family peptidyl-tRNA hydrolase [Microbacterium sp. ARD32]|uniref:baeRF2 domain-containing protein n=1 Tax=Microbacterium sp. ARD32 TaxID=2962577 RepID=UPI002882B644|nr:Vms1/Ankzf1 family peptidyl-tRNA hydrolase [Microbacterium sp. ARD32]MDT0157866.1 Vms1/Ankzf1 family peptidyl-tRNA hydrolase [Microbacterium sp. ARD32]
MNSLELSGLDLHEALSRPDAWTTVYADGPQGDPPPAVESRMRSLRDRMQQAGVPEEDADAVIAALSEDTGVPAPSARWLLVRGGLVVADEAFAAPRRGPERVTHGGFPAIVPLLRHRAGNPLILVVATGKDGAEITLERLGRSEPEHVEQVEGDEHPITKANPGGWSQARYQRSVEEVWLRNQTEIGEIVDEIARTRGPEHIFVTGDAHARGLLLEAIGADTLELVVEVDVITRAAGADDGALTAAIDETVAAAHDQRVASVRDRAAERDGELGASGTGAVVAALQQAQVETLLLDERMTDAETSLLALPETPWVAATPADSYDAGPGTPVAAAEGLVRAAVLTDADVLFIEDEPDEGEPRPDDAPEAPLAVLRWSSAPDDGASGDGASGDGTSGSRPADSDNADGHPSQAEGEDPDEAGGHRDPHLEGHPSQAEGEERDADGDER